MSAGKIEKLVRMANQIGDFFAPLSEAEATAGVATHLKRYWTPKMIDELTGASDITLGSLNTTAARGVAALRKDAAGDVT